MGRIAEALKKARNEREARALLASQPSSRNAADGDTGGSLSGTASRAVDGRSHASVHKDETINLLDSGNEAPCVLDHDESAVAPSPETRSRGRIGPIRRKPAQVVQAAAWDVHPTVVAAVQRSSAITEQYRAARTWLLRRYTPSKMNCIAITSSVPREGKSVTTANLGVVMAEVRHMNVLVMDCDFRQGSISKLYKMPNSPGLSDVLAGRATLDSAVQRTPLGNLYMLPGGTCHEINSTELLNSTTASRLFEEVRERYHYILVDTPPVQCLSDVGVIGALCSGLVMVVRMNKTASHVVRQSMHWLQQNNLQVLGCIAADCSTKGARYEYDGSDHG